MAKTRNENTITQNRNPSISLAFTEKDSCAKFNRGQFFSKSPMKLKTQQMVLLKPMSTKRDTIPTAYFLNSRVVNSHSKARDFSQEFMTWAHPRMCKKRDTEARYLIIFLFFRNKVQYAWLCHSR